MGTQELDDGASSRALVRTYGWLQIARHLQAGEVINETFGDELNSKYEGSASRFEV